MLMKLTPEADPIKHFFLAYIDIFLFFALFAKKVSQFKKFNLIKRLDSCLTLPLSSVVMKYYCTVLFRVFGKSVSN